MRLKTPYTNLQKGREDGADSMIEIVLATSNPHKVDEINSVSMPLGVKFTLPDKGFNPIEDGTTFEENAYAKALAAAQCEKSGRKYFMADDSGLCVDFLNGAPGLKSARYAPSTEKRIEKLLNALKDVKDAHRGAKFVCSLVLTDKMGKILNKTFGICKGTIAHKECGQGGFGYDPIFIVENKNMTMAQLSEDEKNLVSHRGRALMDMLMWIKCSDLK